MRALLRVAAACLGLALISPTQAEARPGGLGARPEARPSELDPYLWPGIEDAVQAASRAEHDPKRGPDNAREILEREKARHGSTRIRTALELRIAATALRAHFLRARRFPEPVRRAQALSTYSRLDLAEPGLRRSLEAALEARPPEGPGPPAGELAIVASVLPRTRAFDAAAFTRPLRAALARVGVKLQVVPPREAAYVLKVGARDAGAAEGRRTVTVSLDLEQFEDGEVVWRSGSFRTSAAPTVDAALEAGLDWLARIGGRDLLFRYLSEGPIPELRALAPDGGSHRH